MAAGWSFDMLIGNTIWDCEIKEDWKIVLEDLKQVLTRIKESPLKLCAKVDENFQIITL